MQAVKETADQRHREALGAEQQQKEEMIMRHETNVQNLRNEAEQQHATLLTAEKEKLKEAAKLETEALRRAQAEANARAAEIQLMAEQKLAEQKLALLQQQHDAANQLVALQNGATQALNKATTDRQHVESENKQLKNDIAKLQNIVTQLQSTVLHESDVTASPQPTLNIPKHRAASPQICPSESEEEAQSAEKNRGRETSANRKHLQKLMNQKGAVSDTIPLGAMPTAS